MTPYEMIDYLLVLNDQYVRDHQEEIANFLWKELSL